MTGEPFIPETITVHLGAPRTAAENITLPFPEYIKNVASSEIYPTWPESALRANIYAQISYALNRVYTEWYPSQGYDFDIARQLEGKDLGEALLLPCNTLKADENIFLDDMTLEELQNALQVPVIIVQSSGMELFNRIIETESNDE